MIAREEKAIIKKTLLLRRLKEKSLSTPKTNREEGKEEEGEETGFIN